MRQAVVIIHGIGEQRPMSTLRGFIGAVLGATDAGASRVFSKPDLISKSFELRRLVAAKSRTRPITDFFEYYWAHHMDGTKLRHLWPWFRGILLRVPWKVPSHLRVLWALSWMLLIIACALYLRSRMDSGSAKAALSWTSLALGGIFILVQGFAITYLGDAARYLSPLPSNIAVRQKIRSEGIELLHRLHQSGDYDRIILVGHSLGSVIGYDILTHLWVQYNTVHARVDRPRQRSLEIVEKLGRVLSARTSENDLKAFQEAQRQLWLEQRGLGFPWRVTDFVTLGSPLAHAAILLANDSAEVTTRLDQRELPSCPPVTDGNRYAYVARYSVNGSPRSIRLLHHAAQFATTRWFNIYVPLRFGLLGDLVGGPLRPIFGPGIVDMPVTDGWAQFVPLLSHTRYWRVRANKAPVLSSSLAALRDALSLNSASWLRERTNAQTAPTAGVPDAADDPALEGVDSPNPLASQPANTDGKIEQGE